MHLELQWGRRLDVVAGRPQRTGMSRIFIASLLLVGLTGCKQRETLSEAYIEYVQFLEMAHHQGSIRTEACQLTATEDVPRPEPIYE